MVIWMFNLRSLVTVSLIQIFPWSKNFYFNFFELFLGWDTEPFVLTEKDGKLYGRGSTDDKGPVLDWINAIEAYKELDQELPINLKFCFEGMEESGSENLDEELARRKDTFLKVKLNFHV